ncbi:hypothetical protein RDWZM_003738 [Blomia tropicalis]|uniref:Farnesyl pyrophosphate synthase n=1 Tax=Blomia tropicalis TaxID=40697 RepID=A0A9Q0MHH7_BLOTA|nr:hypothetical protein RDWZM_003738 [Blomia tropicalis]
MACNDATLVESSIFYLMDRHLREHPCYPQLVQLMHEGFRITGHGQCLDILTEKKAKLSEIGCNLSVYEMDRYRTIVKYKTSFYTFVMPTRMAMYLANRIDEREHQQVESIMTKIGELFQVQDDYIDCYGDPQVIGKIGTDIRDGKCSWLVVNALLNCNELQRSIIQMNYGQDNEKQESIIKNLYRELDMTESFQQYETRMIESIIDEINQLELNQLPVEIFYEPLSHVYHRKK